jgi:hypothetical protein
MSQSEQNLENDNLIRPPFTKKYLDEEDKSQDVVSIRLNQDERDILDKFKKLFDVKSDGKMLKMGFIVGTNVLQRDFPPKILRYIISNERIKLSDYENIKPEM